MTPPPSPGAGSRRGALLRWLTIGLACSVLFGCAVGALPQVERVPAPKLIAPAEAPLVTIARDIALEPGFSGVWPMPEASFALDARLTMIRNATTSLDLQSYLIADDSTGRLILRELRDAARRGVRVRVLVDDLYTTDLDRLLLGLAATPNAQVRLFNPFIAPRGSSMRRLLALAVHFKRLNHRMHNKLFIADGAVAVVGGRNVADEYFLRGESSNFIDFDLLITGAVMPQLSEWFDLYWNSPYVYAVDDVVRASGPPPPAPQALLATFERVTSNPFPLGPAPEPDLASDLFGAPPFSVALRNRRFQFLSAEVSSYADSPNKIDPENHSIAINDTLTHRYFNRLANAKAEVLLFSPYFVPDSDALDHIRRLRAQGVGVRVVTNSLASTDEPLVNIGSLGTQVELLKMGVELFELSAKPLKLDRSLRGLLGSSASRLHAKMAFLDRETVLVGSMNLDPRSSSINTEVGVRVHSARLAEMTLDALKVDDLAGAYRVTLRPDGRGVRWVSADGDSLEEHDVAPETGLWQRIRLMLLSKFVPIDQL